MAKVSSKHLQIDKANASMVTAIAITTFLVVFSLVSVKALISQRNYQARVIDKKESARDQLKKNIEASDDLIVSYKAFVSSPSNILGGNPQGSGEKDGDNARIILDALPSKYDYPALATSVEKLITKNGLKIDSITGTDDQLNQQGKDSSSAPKPFDMPFEVSVTASPEKIKDIINIFDKSIRPFSFTSITITAQGGNLQLNIKAKTFYQPAKNLDLGSEVVK